jgi:hypothetical protein
MTMRFTDDALALLEAYDWPGNVRELENTIQRACALCNSDVLLPSDIPLGSTGARFSNAHPANTVTRMRDALNSLVQIAESSPDIELAPWVERELARIAHRHFEEDAERTAKFLGVDRNALPKLNSPIDITLLRRFALATRLEPGDPLWAIMHMIGEDLLDYVRSLRARLDFIARHAEVWTLDLGDASAKILFLPRTDPLPEEPSLGIDRYIEAQGLAPEIVATVVPDRRSTGYGLSRFQDHPRLDFSRLAEAPGVHFAHARGFVAKTSLTAPTDLRALLLLAANSGSPRA